MFWFFFQMRERIDLIAIMLFIRIFQGFDGELNVLWNSQ